MSQKENSHVGEMNFEELMSLGREARHFRMRQLAGEAVADPDFLADMREVIVAFEPVQTDQTPR